MTQRLARVEKFRGERVHASLYICQVNSSLLCSIPLSWETSTPYRLPWQTAESLQLTAGFFRALPCTRLVPNSRPDHCIGSTPQSKALEVR
jgi:hypothetical protein